MHTIRLVCIDAYVCMSMCVWFTYTCFENVPMYAMNDDVKCQNIAC